MIIMVGNLVFLYITPYLYLFLHLGVRLWIKKNLLYKNTKNGTAR